METTEGDFGSAGEAATSGVSGRLIVSELTVGVGSVSRTGVVSYVIVGGRATDSTEGDG